MSRRTASDTKTKKVSDIKNIPARRLYRGVLEYARRLENGRQHRRNLMSIFHSEQTGLRHKLRDACEKLMFAHSLEYGKKAEEIIWRKVYYEVIQLVKANKKIVKPGSRLELLYKEYLSAAVGYYHHLLLKLQAKYQPMVDVDWPYVGSLLSEVSTRKKQILGEKSSEAAEKTDAEGEKFKKKVTQGEEDEDESILTIDQWAKDVCYRIMLCLGDLGRYLVELGGSRSFSERFYQLALLVKPNIGLPFNQLGTLAGHHTWWGLTSAYYYYRCLEAKNKYEGADGNLQSLLDRNKKNFYQIPTDALENVMSAEEYKKEHTRIFIVSFLYLCDLLRPKTYATDVEITGLCKKLIDALPVCLSHSSLPKDDHSESSYAPVYGSKNSKLSKWTNAGASHHHRHHHSTGDFTHIQPHIVLKMCALCIINIHSLQLSRSNRSSAAIAFTLAFFSHLLGHVTSLIDPEKQNKDEKDNSEKTATEGVNGLEREDANENGDGDASHAQSKIGKRKRQTRLMRRRRHRGSGDSDLSEGELYSGSDLSGSDEDSDDSDSSSSDSANLELSQEGMDETILENPKSSPSKPEKRNGENKSPEQPEKDSKTETVVDRAGLELASSLANGPSTLASLKDISQRMFQPTARRRILLAPSFFNNAPKQASRTPPAAEKDQEVETDDGARALEISARSPTDRKEENGDDALATTGDTELSEGKEIEKEEDTKTISVHVTETNTEPANQGDDEPDGGADQASRKFLQVGAYHQLFAALKLLCDWLDANEKVTAACAQNSKALWSRMAKLASLLPNEEELKIIAAASSDELVRDQIEIAELCAPSAKEWNQVAKLPEDYILCEATSSALHKNERDVTLRSLVCDLSETQQSVIRICRVRCLCHSLVGVEGLGMNYDEATNKFDGPEEPQEEVEHLDIETMERMRKARLMKDMAELRLRNEVDALESQLGTPRTRDASLCLYLVPDALALCHDLSHIKRLLSSGKFFIVIPKTVIDGLDGLKKDLQGARDAIRFLETEFKEGNRYIKAQMAEESSRGVHGERPKLRRNDMQAWRFYRIIECCRYIVEKKATEESAQQGDTTSGLVAILTHSTDKSTLSQNQINAITAAESFGIQVFNAVHFCKLWKKLPAEGK